MVLLVLSQSVVASGKDGGPEGSLPSFGLESTLAGRIEPGEEICYSVPSDGDAFITVLDIQGRTIAKLVEGAKAAGRNSVQWTGQDSTGAAMLKGVYFVRLESGGYTDIRKVIVIQ